MISSADFVILEYTPDLTQAGIAYTKKKILSYGSQENESSPKQLRQQVGDIAVELALRRYLIGEGIPHQFTQLKQFSDPFRQTIIIGGHRCEIINTILTKKWQIRQIRTRSQSLLDLPAYSRNYNNKISNYNADDILIFVYLNCLITDNAGAIGKGLNAGQQVFLISFLPQKWSAYSSRRSLGKITLSGISDDRFGVEIGGLNVKNKIVEEELVFDPGSKTGSQNDFSVIRYVAVREKIPELLQFHSSVLELTHTIKPTDWKNIWVYGLEIILTGFITFREFNKRKSVFMSGFHEPYHSLLTKRNFSSMPISALSPLSDLFARAKDWGYGQ